MHTPTERPQPTLARASWAVFQKDLRAELRTRYALNALVMFALATVLMVSINLGSQLLGSEPLTPLVNAVLLWIVLFFAALTGMARAFVQEETAQTAALLRLHAPPLAVLIGKWLFNTLLLAGLTILTTLTFGLLMSLHVGNLPLLLVVLGLSSLGLATTTTLIAAIIAQANVRSALFAPLAFPVLLPLLVIAVQTTDLAFSGAAWNQALANVQLLVAYVLLTAASTMLLFPLVWEA
ncbi:MAG: heme exporter protein CcmB [Herpetosiphonaceae bacterium]|nr:heme exporter protein CcmB [Herpetosiphonaceae bacterium]